MSIPQFGYSYPTPSSLASSQLLMPSTSPVTTPSSGGGGGGGAGGSTSGSGPAASPGGAAGGCCDGGRILGTNPHTGQPICSCQYSPGLLTYSRVAAGLSDSVYPGSPYATPGYVPLGTDPSAFYPPLTSPYDLKEAGETWRGITQPTACYPYDPTAMSTYPYTNAYGAMDINSAARRKNATRENTNTLKAWLYEHRKNPYPTKGEKIMLAIITKMTLTQVSTWFANARRRLKKENKMTWSPRNRSGDADGDGEGDDEEDEDAKSKDGEENEKREQKGRDKEEVDTSCKDKKDSCSLAQSQASDTIAHAKRLFEEDAHSPAGNRNLPAHQHNHHPPPPPPPPPPPSQAGILGQHHHHHGQQQQHSPHDGANFLGITGSSSSSSSQPYPGMTSPEAVGLTSPLDSKRPDSLCSNSNDSGLSDVNCNFAAEAQAAVAAGGLDAPGGFRPKIWSLAHVATSDNASSPYLSSVSVATSVSGSRSSSAGLGPRGSGLAENASKPPTSLLPGMQPWGGGGLYCGSPARPGSFGMNMNINMNMDNHHKVAPMAAPMFSHPLSGMSSGLGSSPSGYAQIPSLYPHSKLSVD